MNAAQYEKEHEALLSDWSCEQPGFFFDGVICPEEWFSESGCRPLFLLKEAYIGKNDPNEHDLRKWMNGEMDYKITRPNFIVFKKILQWASVMFGAFDQPDALEKSKTTPDFYCLKNPTFKKIAYLNLKKSGGNRFSDEKDLRTYLKADKNGERLCRQIELAAPTVIVCCGTMRFLPFVPGFDGIPVDKKGSPCDAYVAKINGRAISVIDFCHPAYFGKGEADFCRDLKEAWDKIKGKA